MQAMHLNFRFFYLHSSSSVNPFPPVAAGGIIFGGWQTMQPPPSWSGNPHLPSVGRSGHLHQTGPGQSVTYESCTYPIYGADSDSLRAVGSLPQHHGGSASPPSSS